MNKTLPPIHKKLLPWYKTHGRHNLPWQIAKSPYTVWLSEIMLQQTQVATVIPYFLNFLKHFPSVQDLANADIDHVLGLWSGLGYYSRARNLHKTAQLIMTHFDGEFPSNIESLQTLPGIGPSTAAAIMSLAFHQKHAILDGNVKRVLCRYHGLRVYPEEPAVKKQLWELANYHMSPAEPAAYTQAIMDLGATVCNKKAPPCETCPLVKSCICYRDKAFADIPKAKPKKVLPVKSVYFAVISNNKGQILLEKRPDSGIWGGLWSFIESPELESLQTKLDEQKMNFKGSPTSLPHFRHTFTHFKLIIHPYYYQLKQPKQLRDNQIWYTPEKQSTIGLAKPVSKILISLLESA